MAGGCGGWPQGGATLFAASRQRRYWAAPRFVEAEACCVLGGPHESRGFHGERKKEPADMELPAQAGSGMELASSDDAARPEALPLDSATFEKVDETFLSLFGLLFVRD